MSTLSLILLYLMTGLIIYPVILSLYGQLGKRTFKHKFTEYLVYLYRSIVFALVWPLIGIIVIIDLKMKRNETMKDAVNEMKRFIYRTSVNDGKLRYWKMGGKGSFYCKECGYSQEIISFLHGFGYDAWTNSGYQCQNCGKFHEIENDHKLAALPKCDCGGILSKGNPLFCSGCKSYKVGYRCTLIT